MPRGTSPTRYAQAIFQIGLESGSLEEWSKDLGVILVALENKELCELLDSPHLQAATKFDTITKALKDLINPLALNLLCLLAVRNLVHQSPAILFAYEKMLYSHRGVERAEVISAIGLDQEQEKSVSELLKEIVGKEIKLTSVVKPEIIGGMIARVGDRVIDGSTKTKLETMRRKMLENAS